MSILPRRQEKSRATIQCAVMKMKSMKMTIWISVCCYEWLSCQIMKCIDTNAVLPLACIQTLKFSKRSCWRSFKYLWWCNRWTEDSFSKKFSSKLLDEKIFGIKQSLYANLYDWNWFLFPWEFKNLFNCWELVYSCKRSS